MALNGNFNKAAIYYNNRVIGGTISEASNDGDESLLIDGSLDTSYEGYALVTPKVFNGDFDATYTVGCFYMFDHDLPEGTTIEVKLWDAAGQSGTLLDTVTQDVEPEALSPSSEWYDSMERDTDKLYGIQEMRPTCILFGPYRARSYRITISGMVAKTYHIREFFFGTPIFFDKNVSREPRIDAVDPSEIIGGRSGFVASTQDQERSEITLSWEYANSHDAYRWREFVRSHGSHQPVVVAVRPELTTPEWKSANVMARMVDASGPSRRGDAADDRYQFTATFRQLPETRIHKDNVAPQVVTIVENVGTASTHDFTYPGFGTPTAAIIRYSKWPQISRHNLVHTVYWDGTTTRTAACSDEDGVSTTDADSYLASDVRIYYHSGTLDAQGTISTITDGIRISWSDVPGGSPITMICTLFKGISAKCGDHQLASAASSNSITGASFQPQLALFELPGPGLGAPPSSALDAYIINGVAADESGGIVNRCISVGRYDNISGTTAVWEQIAVKDACIIFPWDGEGAAVTSFNSDGITIAVATGADCASDRVAYMLLGGFDEVGVEDADAPPYGRTREFRTATGKPMYLELVQSSIDAWATTQYTEGQLAIGMFDGETQACVAYAAGTSGTVTEADHITDGTLLSRVPNNEQATDVTTGTWWKVIGARFVDDGFILYNDPDQYNISGDEAGFAWWARW